MDMKPKILLSLITGISIFMDAHSEPNASLPLSFGRTQASVAGVTNNLGILSGDFMLPIYGNQDHFVFADVMGDRATDTTYQISPGGGYRFITNNQIIGTYFFTDYEKTNMGENFWNLSPGVEWISPRWDAHINGYFPTNKQQQSGTTAYADTFDDYSSITFEEGTHNQYDELVTPYAVIGNGADIEIGYSFKNENNQLRSRVYMGGYYYTPPADTDTQNISGITAGLTRYINPSASLTIFNSYDSVTHYNVGMSLTLTLGSDSGEFSEDVHTRLLDPIQRHVGVIDTGAGDYDQQSFKDEGNGLEYDNVYFVSNDGSGDGTYGNPLALDQAALDTINAESPNSARIYIQGGDDANYEINSETAGTSDYGDGLVVYNGQDFYGRTTDYTAPASGDEQPQIEADSGYNGFIIQDSEENTFSDLKLSSSGGSNNTGILIYNTSDNDSELNIENTNISQFSIGVYGENSSNGTLTINTNHSQFNGNTSTANNAEAYGMEVLNSGAGDLIVNATNSQFNNNTVSGTGGGRAAGFYGINSGTGKMIINATNSQFNNNTASSNSTVQVDAFGAEVINTSTGTLTFNANNSTFNNNTVTANGNPVAFGLYAQNNGLGSLTLNTYMSQFNSNATYGDNAKAYGIMAVNMNSGTLIIDASHSEFNNNSATGSNNYAFGLSAYNTSSGTLTIEATHSQFANNTGAGLYVRNTASGILSVTDLTGSIFYNNRDYGIYGAGTAGHPELTTIDNNGAIFLDNNHDTGSNGQVTFTS